MSEGLQIPERPVTSPTQGQSEPVQPVGLDSQIYPFQLESGAHIPREDADPSDFPLSAISKLLVV